MARRRGGKGCALWHNPWGLFVKAAPRLPLIVLWAELAPIQLLGCENYKYSRGTFLSSASQLQKAQFGRGAQSEPSGFFLQLSFCAVTCHWVLAHPWDNCQQNKLDILLISIIYISQKVNMRTHTHTK